MALACLDVLPEATSQQEQDMIDLLLEDVNQEHPSLTRNETLMRVAQARATDMATRNYFSHTDPDGYGPNYHAEKAGYYLPDAYGHGDTDNQIESISAGDIDASDIWAAFMASDPHKDHLLGRTEFFAEQDEYGVGYAYNVSSTYDHYWVVLIARRKTKMGTRFIFTPGDAELPSSNAPQKTTVNDRPVLAFDGSTDEHCYWTAIAPQNLSGTITVAIFHMNAVSSGDIYFRVAIEAISQGDMLDLDSATSFDSDNDLRDTVATTIGVAKWQPVTMVNADSIAPGDLFRIHLTRDADHTWDTATGDCYILAVELRDET